MVHDLDMIKKFYSSFSKKITKIRTLLSRPLTLAEKILYAHLYKDLPKHDYRRGEDYVDFRPDRVAFQDATAQMALLQFMNAGQDKSAVPSTVHCDHLILADVGANEDLVAANDINKEVYDFLRTASARYGLGFWKPGAGIIHQVILENYAFPGGMMVGTDSHTPNAGGLGMIAIGVGGADAVDVMTGMEWELKMPKLIGVHLKGQLNGWTSAKDVILKLAGILTVKGGTNAIIEYFGQGADALSATGKATICNMGAEVGATTSIFPYDDMMYEYLVATGRREVADLAKQVEKDLRPDLEILTQPEKYYDQVIEIDLDKLEPHVNGPFTPDAATPISEFAARVKSEAYPRKMEVALIGSCTNSSYQDMTRAVEVIREAVAKGLKIQAPLIITPGSEQIRRTMERDGLIMDFEVAGGMIMANACGPCIGQWKRHADDPARKNSIVTSFNRNFAKRNDGNPNTYAFVVSPEIAVSFAIAGDLCFNPITDTLINEKGEKVKLSPPTGETLPAKGFADGDNGYLAAPEDGSAVRITVHPESQRLQLLSPFSPFSPSDFKNMPLLIKTKGKCTTDHISMAGSWLKYRGHLENISNNMLIGAINCFNDQANLVYNPLSKDFQGVPDTAKAFKLQGLSSVVVAEENYGEGSSREHAAMEPRFLNVKVILAKSFARIHETNLKKQGMLALTFVNKDDYEQIRQDDRFEILGINDITPGRNLFINIIHQDGTTAKIEVAHSYNETQIAWFKAGSALNYNANQK